MIVGQTRNKKIRTESVVVVVFLFFGKGRETSFGAGRVVRLRSYGNDVVLLGAVNFFFLPHL